MKYPRNSPGLCMLFPVRVDQWLIHTSIISQLCFYLAPSHLLQVTCRWSWSHRTSCTSFPCQPSLSYGILPVCCTQGTRILLHRYLSWLQKLPLPTGFWSLPFHQQKQRDNLHCCCLPQLSKFTEAKTGKEMEGFSGAAQGPTLNNGGSKWNTSEISIMWLYKLLACHRSEFCSQCWSPHLKQDRGETKRVQRVKDSLKSLRAFRMRKV